MEKLASVRAAAFGAALAFSAPALAQSDGPAALNAPPIKMEVTAKDFAYHPDRLTVPRGRMVDLTMINDGPVAYSLVLKLPAAEVKFSDPVDANGRRTLSFRAPEKPGEYEIYCPIGDHRARGMTATLVVR